MDGVALSACNVVESVRRVANVCARKTVRMALQAGIKRLFSCQRVERNNGCLTAVSLHMRASRSVTTLAARVGLLLFAARNAFKMRILVKLEPDIGMTCLAHCAAGVHMLRSLLRM